MLYATKIPFSHWPPDKAANVQVKTRDDILEDIFASDEIKAATDSNITERTCPTMVQDTFENIKDVYSQLNWPIAAFEAFGIKSNNIF